MYKTHLWKVICYHHLTAIRGLYGTAYITLYGVSCLSCHSKLTEGELKVSVISLVRLGENILCQAE